MSFLNQLKTQAKALQKQRQAAEETLDAFHALTDKACDRILPYFQDLAQQLTIIEPDAPVFSLDNKAPWPPMKLVDFRVDARRKSAGEREVLDYVALGWRVVPKSGEKLTGTVSVNFPTDMRRVEDRLALGPVKHQRLEVRLPEGSALQEVRYVYETHTRGSVTATADREHGQIHFRLLNTCGFEVVKKSWPVGRIDHDLLDELARRIVGQQSAFV
jgi:hypothetical protein